jgi:hypothetical protein
MAYLPGESIGYTPSVQTQAPTFNFKGAIDGMAGLVADLDDHDTKVKELQQRRKANANATMMNDT